MVSPLRWPQWRNIAAKTRLRLVWYVTEVVPLFVLGTLVLFVLGLVFWVGWTILTVHVEPEADQVLPDPRDE